MEELVFKNIEGKDCKRIFSNSTYVSGTPSNDVTIDFYEEYLDSIAMMTQDDQNDGENIYIVREKKVSITTSREEKESNFTEENLKDIFNVHYVNTFQRGGNNERQAVHYFSV